MSDDLIGDLATPPHRDVPAEWQARQVVRDGEVETVTGPTITGPTEPVASDEELLRKWGYDPATIELVGPIAQWRKERKDGSFLVSYYFRHRQKAQSHDLPALYDAARRKPRKPLAPAATGRTSVVVLADPQIGKTGSRGGTPQLLERMVEKRERLAVHLKRQRPERVVLVDAGDLFEGFNSGGNPMFTNDLSLAQQMDVAATELFEYVKTCARYGPVDVLAVPANHTGWRDGKQYLGKPGDDLALFVHRQVEKVANAAGLDVTWHFPPAYDEAVTLDVRGAVLGVVHGDQYRPGKALEWWGKQQFGGQPIGSADVLVTGHYHCFEAKPSGRNPYSGRAKWWLQAPTLDNGSDWFRNIAGQDSDPGLLVFDMTDAGFDLQSLTIL